MPDRVGFEHIRRSNRLALGYAISNVGFREVASGNRTAGRACAEAGFSFTLCAYRKR